MTENVTGVASFPARNKPSKHQIFIKMFGSPKNANPVIFYSLVLSQICFFLLGSTKGHFETSVSP